MAAAESANNSSVISCTVPFLFVGLPITGTELLLDNWMLVNKATNVDARILYDSVTLQALGTWPMWTVMLMCLTMVSVICFYLTSRFVGVYSMVNRIPSKWFGLMIKLSIVAFTWLLVRDSDLGAASTVFTIVFFTAVGVWAQKKGHDVVALPISLMIGSFAIEKFSIAWQLWS
jgi:TctA family transporter